MNAASYLGRPSAGKAARVRAGLGPRRAFSAQERGRNRASDPGEQDKSDAHDDETEDHHDRHAMRRHKVVKQLSYLRIRVTGLCPLNDLNYSRVCVGLVMRDQGSESA